MSTISPHQGLAGGDELARITRRLRSIAARVRAVLVARGVLVTLALLASLAIALGLIDYLLRLPAGVRLALLAGLAAAAWRCWARLIAPALRVRPTPTDIALRIEKREPALRGILASAIDLERRDRLGQDEGERITRSLAAAALGAARRRLIGASPAGVLRLGELGRALGLAALVGVLLGVLGARTPTLVSVGTRRVLAPWAGADWPKRYAITDVTGRDPRPVDVATPIRALVGSADSGVEGSGRAMVRWRLLDGRKREISAWSPAVLVPQRQRDPATGIPVFEQLIDAQGAAARSEETSFTLEYRITTRDDQTPTRRIALVRPPELRSTRVEITLPGYAAAIAGSGLARSGTIETREEELGVSPVLAGSRVELVWRFSKPVSVGEALTPEWVARVGRENTIELFDQPSADSMRLVLTAGAGASIEPAVIDASGIPVRTPIVVTLGVLGDRAPGAGITDPARDEAVSSHAVLEVSAELSDDIGLWKGRIDAVRASAPVGSEGAPPEPVGEAVTLVTRELDAAQRSALSRRLEVASLDAAPGDEVRVSATAWDLRGAMADAGSEGMTRSGDRVLRIVADRELIERIRQGLTPVRGALRQLDEQQAALQQMVRDGDAAAGREQRALTGRLDANRRAVAALRESIERNTLDDEALAGLLGDAHNALAEASRASEEAGERIDRGADEPAREAQKRVRDRLGELLSMLDRGQDSWLALRGVQRLRDDLASLREDTAALSARTAGKAIEQLSGEERNALEKILDRQRQNAQDASEALSTLDERAQQLEENDPTQAEALRRAARQARVAQLGRMLRRASEQIGANQTASATQTQQEALDELDRMLEELDNSIRNRDNALRRELASIIESIKGLIWAQQGEIDLLGGALGGGAAVGLDQRMIALVGNTLSVRDEALGAFPETRSIAELIRQAGDAQNGAISALRRSPSDLGEASRFERASLLHLQSALEEAQRQDDQAAGRQAQHLRQELRKAYQEGLEAQTGVRDRTRPLVGGAMSRRQRALARAIAQTQDGIRVSMDELLAQTAELGDAPVFALAHAQLDRLMTASGAGLTGAAVTRRALDAQEGSLAILSSLVEVLGERTPEEPEDFEDGSTSSGGQSGGSQNARPEPAIPPMAQLQLLRTMQQLAADQTRALSEEAGAPDAASVRAISELQGQLFQQATKLIEQMNQSPGAPGEDEAEPASARDEQKDDS